MSSVYKKPQTGQLIRDLDRRLKSIERNVGRNLIFSGGSVHIPGGLTLGGGGPEGGDGGRGSPITGGIPAIPTGFNATSAADEENVWIDLVWTFPDTSASPVTQFEIRWQRTGDTDYQYAVTANSDAYQIYGLQSNTNYTVGIRSISQLNVAGTWVTDTVLAATDSTAPAQVANLIVAGNLSATTQMCSWTNNSEADLAGYEINLSRASIVTAVPGTTLASSDVTWPAVDDTLNGMTVEIVAGPGAGTSATITDYVGSTKTLHVSAWPGTAPTTASKVVIKLTAGKIGAFYTNGIFSKQVTATIFTADGLDGTAATLYVWQVAAYDRSGNIGTYSATASATTTLIPNAHIAELTANKIKAGTIGTEVLKLSNSANSRIESYDGTSLLIRGNGTALFTNVEITGLATGGMAIGTGDSIFKVDQAGQHWAGDAVYGDAPFRVSVAGALVATSATITGAITATSGSFTGAITASSGTFGRTTTAGDLSMSVNGASLDFKTVGGTGEVVATVNTEVMARLWQHTSGLTIMGYVSGTIGRNSTSDWIWFDTGSMVFNVSTGDYTWLKATGTTLMTLSESGASAQLKLHSGHISEGGEILLQQATHSNFTTDVYIDNESDQIRIHDGSTVKFLIEMRGEVAGDGKVDGRVRVYGRGIAYNGTMAGGGTRNDMGFSWSSPNIYGHVDGAVAAIIGVVSDRRLKEDIQPVVGSDSLAKVMAYRPITYLPVGLDGDRDPEAERHTGMIADEVELIDSSLVSGEADDPDQFQSVYYAGVIPDLLQAFQDIVGRVDTLESA